MSVDKTVRNNIDIFLCMHYIHTEYASHNVQRMQTDTLIDASEHSQRVALTEQALRKVSSANWFDLLRNLRRGTARSRQLN